MQTTFFLPPRPAHKAGGITLNDSSLPFGLCELRVSRLPCRRDGFNHTPIIPGEAGKKPISLSPLMVCIESNRIFS